MIYGKYVCPLLPSQALGGQGKQGWCKCSWRAGWCNHPTWLGADQSITLCVREEGRARLKAFPPRWSETGEELWYWTKSQCWDWFCMALCFFYPSSFLQKVWMSRALQSLKELCGMMWKLFSWKVKADLIGKETHMGLFVPIHILRPSWGDALKRQSLLRGFFTVYSLNTFSCTGKICLCVDWAWEDS